MPTTEQTPPTLRDRIARIIADRFDVEVGSGEEESADLVLALPEIAAALSAHGGGETARPADVVLEEPPEEYDCLDAALLRDLKLSEEYSAERRAYLRNRLGGLSTLVRRLAWRRASRALSREAGSPIPAPAPAPAEDPACPGCGHPGPHGRMFGWLMCRCDHQWKPSAQVQAGGVAAPLQPDTPGGEPEDEAASLLRTVYGSDEEAEADTPWG